MFVSLLYVSSKNVEKKIKKHVQNIILLITKKSFLFFYYIIHNVLSVFFVMFVV